MPARTVSEISLWLRISMTVDSMPALASRWESISPAGPAPMMATWVVMTLRCAMCVLASLRGPGPLRALRYFVYSAGGASGASGPVGFPGYSVPPDT